NKPTRKITDDPYGAAILIRRLVMEQGFVYWRRYLTAFALMGVTAGATAGSAYILGQVINQAYIDKNVTGIAILSGVTVLLLVSLIFVMVTQDPVLSFIGLVVVPPAMLILRKLVKRIKGLAHNQFTGSADIMETMQESLQGIRTVKASTLEQTMQRRIDE